MNGTIFLKPLLAGDGGREFVEEQVRDKAKQIFRQLNKTSLGTLLGFRLAKIRPVISLLDFHSSPDRVLD